MPDPTSPPSETADATTLADTVRDLRIGPTPCPFCGYPRSPSEAGTPCDRCQDSIVTQPGGPSLRIGVGFPVKDFAIGFTTFFASSLALFNRREYVGKLGLPIAANIVALLVVFGGMFWGFWELFVWLLDVDWGWADGLRSAISWASGVVAIVLSAVSIVLLAPVIIETVTGPFMDPLAQATEEFHGGPDMRPIQTTLWASFVVGVRSSAQILLIQITVLLPCLLLSFFGIGALFAMLVAAFINAVVWFDVPFGRRGWGLRHRVAVLRRNWALAMGFGLAFQVGLFIPIYNFLLLVPTSAVAASSLYFRLDKRPTTAIPS